MVTAAIVCIQFDQAINFLNPVKCFILFGSGSKIKASFR